MLTITNPLDDALLSQLFVRMTSNYPYSWPAQWKTENALKAARAEWAMDLGEFHGDTIMRALRKCKVKYPDMPPTLPQFTAICRSYQPRGAANQELKRITRKTTSKNESLENIKKIKSMMSGAGVYVDGYVIQKKLNDDDFEKSREKTLKDIGEAIQEGGPA